MPDSAVDGDGQSPQDLGSAEDSASDLDQPDIGTQLDTSVQDVVFDTGLVDSGPVDSGSVDMLLGDTAPADTGQASDVGPEDQGPDVGLDGGGGGDVGTGNEPYLPVLYPADRVQSPITEFAADVLREIVSAHGSRQDDVFIKVGASGTVSHAFLYCFAEDQDVQLSDTSPLWETIRHFRTTAVPAGPDQDDPEPIWSFDRDTIAARNGRSAIWVMTDSEPPPIDLEIADVNPRFAFINYGTNDMNRGCSTCAAPPYQYAMWAYYFHYSALMDHLIEQGVIPIVTGIPRRAGSAEADLWVPTYNAIARGLAQHRQIPFVDMWQAYEDLPGSGIGDGTHGSTHPQGHNCYIESADDLQYGSNTRNLISIDALDRARRVALDAQAEPWDSQGEYLAGSGTGDDPFLIESLPFVHTADTSAFGEHNFNLYSCDDANERGPEHIYRLDLEQPVRLRLIVFPKFDQGISDVDINVLTSLSESECVHRDDELIHGTFGAGTHYFALDTFGTGDENAGPYMFVVVECEPGDTWCDTDAVAF